MGQAFNLTDVLSVSTGRLLGDMSGIYEVMGYLTNDPHISTIGLLAMGKTCREAILQQHPGLKLVDVGDLDKKLAQGGSPEAACAQWVAELSSVYGDSLELEPIAGIEPRDVLDDIETIMERRSG